MARGSLSASPALKLIVSVPDCVPVRGEVMAAVGAAFFRPPKNPPSPSPQPPIAYNHVASNAKDAATDMRCGRRAIFDISGHSEAKGQRELRQSVHIVTVQNKRVDTTELESTSPKSHSEAQRDRTGHVGGLLAGGAFFCGLCEALESCLKRMRAEVLTHLSLASGLAGSRLWSREDGRYGRATGTDACRGWPRSAYP